MPKFLNKITNTSGGVQFPDNTIELSGHHTVVSLSGNTSLTTQSIVLASGTITLTLPSAATGVKPITIKNMGTGTVTVNPTGGQFIDTASTQIINVKFASLTLVPDGTSNWYII
jgi:hypothetical protein